MKLPLSVQILFFLSMFVALYLWTVVSDLFVPPTGYILPDTPEWFFTHGLSFRPVQFAVYSVVAAGIAVLYWRKKAVVINYLAVCFMITAFLWLFFLCLCATAPSIAIVNGVAYGPFERWAP